MLIFHFLPLKTLQHCGSTANTKLFAEQKIVLNEENPQSVEVVEEQVQENDSVVEESSLDTSVESTEEVSCVDYKSPPESPTTELLHNIDLQVLDISEETFKELLENKDNLGDGGVFDELLEGYFSDSSPTLFIDTDYESDNERGKQKRLIFIIFIFSALFSGMTNPSG